MVLLTMTPSVVEGLRSLPQDTTVDAAQGVSLAKPAVGNPISHSQIVDLWRCLKSSGDGPSVTLELLLRGSSVYTPPPPPKPEPSPEYKALMARLRLQEEARSYERMVNPAQQPFTESFSDRFPHASAHAFAAVNQPHTAADTGDDDGITYNDVHRQLLLLMNFLVSIIGVAATLWVAARWWSLPARLFLTMGGGFAVAVAEVSVYSIYVWKMGDAKQRQDAVKEVKEVVETWTIGLDQGGEEKDEQVIPDKTDSKEENGVRKRIATESKEVD